MRGLIIYENDSLAKKIMRMLELDYGINNISKIKTDDIKDCKDLCTNYDYIVFQVENKNMHKFDSDSFSCLFSRLEEITLVLLTDALVKTNWNDKFDYIFSDTSIRELAKLIINKQDSNQQNSCITSWAANRLIVQSKKEYHFIRFEDVVFIEKEDKQIKIHTLDKLIQTRDNLSMIEKKLPDNFMSPHRAFIINLDYISRIKNVGNRSYEILFKDTDKVALMSRYKAVNILGIINHE